MQILGTMALLRAFDLRDFAIGNVYAKTEAIRVAIVSALALREALQPLGWVTAFACMRSSTSGIHAQEYLVSGLVFVGVVGVVVFG